MGLLARGSFKNGRNVKGVWEVSSNGSISYLLSFFFLEECRFKSNGENIFKSNFLCDISNNSISVYKLLFVTLC